MATSKWMIHLGHDIWRVIHAGVVIHSERFAEDADPHDQVAHMARTAAGNGYRGEPILLALDSDMCLAATFAVDSPQQLRKRQALLFQLEESIPWEAEEVVADFVGHGSSVFAVAVQHRWLTPWLDAMESNGFPIQSISPLALLGLAHHVTCSDWPRFHAVLWARERTLELFVVQQDRPQDWRVIPIHVSMLLQVLQALSLAHAGRLPLVGYDLDKEIEEVLRQQPEVDLLTASENSPVMHVAAAEVSQLALNSETDLWIELRRGQLNHTDRLRSSRGRLGALAVAAAFFAIALTVAFSVRVHRYQTQVDLLNAKQAEVYRMVFPEADSVPQGVRSRLASELAELRGMRGESSRLATPIPALEVLYHFLAALPPGMRYRISEIRLDEGRLDINGEVRDHGDADQLATSLRDHGFEVSSPFTQRQSPQNVIVRLTAHRVVDPGTTSEGTP